MYNARASMEKFPDLIPTRGDWANQSQYDSSPVATNGDGNGISYSDQWQARKNSDSQWAQDQSYTGRGNNRQKSLSDAFRTVRTRKASVSANIHEISDALKAPVSPRLIVWSPS